MLYFVLQNSTHINNERNKRWSSRADGFSANPVTTRFQLSKTQMNKDFKTYHLCTFMDLPVQSKLSRLEMDYFKGHILYFDKEEEGLGFKLCPEKYVTPNILRLRAIHDLDMEVLESMATETHNLYITMGKINDAIRKYTARCDYVKSSMRDISAYFESSACIINDLVSVDSGELLDIPELSGQLKDSALGFQIINSGIDALFSKNLQPVKVAYNESRSKLIEYLKNSLIFDDPEAKIISKA